MIEVERQMGSTPPCARRPATWPHVMPIAATDIQTRLPVKFNVRAIRFPLCQSERHSHQRLRANRIERRPFAWLQIARPAAVRLSVLRWRLRLRARYAPIADISASSVKGQYGFSASASGPSAVIRSAKRVQGFR